MTTACLFFADERDPLSREWIKLGAYAVAGVHENLVEAVAKHRVSRAASKRATLPPRSDEKFYGVSDRYPVLMEVYLRLWEKGALGALWERLKFTGTLQDAVEEIHWETFRVRPGIDWARVVCFRHYGGMRV